MLDNHGLVSGGECINNTEKIMENKETNKRSCWYWTERVGLDDDHYSGTGVDRVAIKKVQDSMYYYLVRDENVKAEKEDTTRKQEQKVEEKKEEENEEKKTEEKVPNELFSVENIQGEDENGIVTIKYNRLTQKDTELVYFTVHIPDTKKKLLVSRELIMLESKVFEGMLNSDMLESTSNEMTLQKEQSQEGEESSCEYFDLAIRFIHTGSLGIPQTSFNESDPSKIAWKDLLGLLRVADQYQIESLTTAISRVVNQFNALTIGLTCLEFSDDCKSIILPMVCDVLAFNPACVVSDMIYSGLPLDTPDDEEIQKYLQDPSLALKEYPFLDTPLTPPMFHKLLAVPLLEPLTKIIISLPLELFEGMMSSPYCTMNPGEMMTLITLWMLQDIENRYTDAYRLISDNIDWSLCSSEILYALIYFVFIGIGKTMPQFKSTCDEAHDLLHMSMFKRNNTISDENWQEYISQRFPNKAARSKPKNELRYLILGLDAAGKTALLYYLKLGEVITTIPTIGFNVETINYKEAEITMWDVGGGGKIKALWRHYYENTQCVIYVVDSNDRERIEEAADELSKVASDEQLKDCSFLILANKQDLPNAMSVSEIADKMKLTSLKKWYIQACSALNGEGIFEGLDWTLYSTTGVSTETVQCDRLSNHKKYLHFGRMKFN